MNAPHPLPDALIERIAQRFKLLGEPMRIRLLDSLRDGPATVSELVEKHGAGQQNVSKHLNVLHDAGVLSRSKRGNFVEYEIADDTMFALCDLVCGDLRRQVAELDQVLSGGGGR